MPDPQSQRRRGSNHKGGHGGRRWRNGARREEWQQEFTRNEEHSGNGDSSSEYGTCMINQ